MVQQNLGVLANIRGDLEAAKTHYRAALRAFGEMGDDEASSWVLNNIGMLLNDLGSPSRAERSFRRGLTIARTRRDRPLEGILLGNYAEGLIAMKRWDDAAEALDEAFNIACEGDDLARAGEALKFHGVLERERGRFDEARQRFQEALNVATSMDDRLLIGEVLRERGELHQRMCDATSAAADLAEALKVLEAAGATRDADDVRLRLADLTKETGSSD
jgi:tetratricopeptide (TPR) repeat protein